MRLLMVLGMHRSGTSCLTGLLGDAGAWLGPVEKGSPHNPKGNNENRRVMNLNKAVLAANDASWFEPPPGDARWTDEQLATADEILADVLAPGRTTAMKDPRSLFTGRGWWDRAEAAGAEVVAIGTFRRPERVVASLVARDPDLDPAACLRTWEAYNRRLLAWHDRLGFPVVDFDLDPDGYLASVSTAFGVLGLPRPDALGFFDESLRHRHEAHHDPEVRALYDELRRRAVS